MVDLQLSSLSPDEIGMFSEIARRVSGHRGYNKARGEYYEAHRKVKDMGISIPPQLKNVQSVVGWPGLVVDALEERLNINGFVIPGIDVNDFGIPKIWKDNNLHVEHPEGHLEALIHGVSFLATSRGFDGEPDPLITIEPPSSMSAIYDPRRRRLSAAGSLALDDEDKPVAASLYLPNQTVRIELARGKWVVMDRDIHNRNRVMVRRMVNRPRSSKQWGRSEITRPIISYTDSAMRTLLGAEVAREFYNSPQRYILGADESAFEDGQGNKRNAWQSYLGRFLALTADEDGNKPEVGQFSAASPLPYFDQVKMYSQLVAGEAALPSNYMGFVSDNPASADQIRAVEARHVTRAERRQVGFGSAWAGAIEDAVLLRDGSVPAEFVGLEVNWRDAATPTKAAAADAVMKQVAAGALPAESEVTLEQLGYNTVDIERIVADRRTSRVSSLVDNLRTSVDAATKDPAVAELAGARGVA